MKPVARKFHSPWLLKGVRYFAIAVLAILFSSCSATYKLRKAEKLIQEAIAKGATVKQDTVFKEIKFTAPALNFETIIDSPNWNDTLYVIGATASDGDSIKVKIKRTHVPATATEPEKEFIYIKADCPDQEVKKTVPVAINRSIKAGISVYQFAVFAIIVAVIAFFTGRFTSPRRR